MDDWVFKSGHCVSVQRRKLYRLVADQIRRIPKMEKDLLKFIMKLVREYDTEGLEKTDDAAA